MKPLPTVLVFSAIFVVVNSAAASESKSGNLDIEMGQYLRGLVTDTKGYNYCSSDFDCSAYAGSFPVYSGIAIASET